MPPTLPFSFPNPRLPLLFIILLAVCLRNRFPYPHSAVFFAQLDYMTAPNSTSHFFFPDCDLNGWMTAI